MLCTYQRQKSQRQISPNMSTLKQSYLHGSIALEVSENMFCFKRTGRRSKTATIGGGLILYWERFLLISVQNSKQQIQQTFCNYAITTLAVSDLFHKNVRMHIFTLAISTLLESTYCRSRPRFKLNILCVCVFFAWAVWGSRDLSMCRLPVKPCEWLQIHYHCETILRSW